MQDKQQENNKYYLLVEISAQDLRWVPVLDLINGQIDLFLPVQIDKGQWISMIWNYLEIIRFTPKKSNR